MAIVTAAYYLVIMYPVLYIYKLLFHYITYFFNVFVIPLIGRAPFVSCIVQDRQPHGYIDEVLSIKLILFSHTHSQQWHFSQWHNMCSFQRNKSAKQGSGGVFSRFICKNASAYNIGVSMLHWQVLIGNCSHDESAVVCDMLVFI